MSIITKSNVLKGVVSQFTLNKSDLLSNSVVSNDSYFSDSLNWNRVNVVYKSSPGSQYEVVEFDATQETPVGNFLVSERARDLFEVQKLQIVDFDGGILEILRSDLTVADFDVEFTSEPSTPELPEGYVLCNTRDFSEPQGAWYEQKSPGVIVDGTLRLAGDDDQFFYQVDLQNVESGNATGRYIVRVYIDENTLTDNVSVLQTNQRNTTPYETIGSTPAINLEAGGVYDGPAQIAYSYSPILDIEYTGNDLGDGAYISISKIEVYSQVN